MAVSSGLVLVASCGEDGPVFDRSASITIGNSVVAEVDERFLSVAVDSAQVVGGLFWDPEGLPGVVGQEDIAPYDFSRPALRNMAAALAPALLRIGGSDADLVFYDLDDTGTLPEGYEYAMTRAQLDGVDEFASAVGFDIMFTLNAGAGPRDEDNAWTDSNARALVSYATAQSYPVAVWELGNEVNGFPLILGLSVSGSQFAADAAVARALVDELDPGTPLVAPAIAYWPIAGEIREVFEDFLVAGGGDALDLLTWHFYPQQSIRCPLTTRRAEPGTMLEPAHLDEIERWRQVVQDLRDEHAPHAQMFLGETGNAQCGGEPGISDAYEGGFWWLDQLGLMARAGQRFVVRQTLSGSNYGLINDVTLEPAPDYFNSLLWKQLMGTRVLDATSDDPLVRAYAHCTPGRPGNATVLAINLDPETSVGVDLTGIASTTAEVYAVTADGPDATTLKLGGTRLAVAADGTPPALVPVQGDPDGPTVLSPLSYAFVVVDGANACN